MNRSRWLWAATGAAVALVLVAVRHFYLLLVHGPTTVAVMGDQPLPPDVLPIWVTLLWPVVVVGGYHLATRRRVAAHAHAPNVQAARVQVHAHSAPKARPPGVPFEVIPGKSREESARVYTDKMGGDEETYRRILADLPEE